LRAERTALGVMFMLNPMSEGKETRTIERLILIRCRWPRWLDCILSPRGDILLFLLVLWCHRWLTTRQSGGTPERHWLVEAEIVLCCKSTTHPLFWRENGTKMNMCESRVEHIVGVGRIRRRVRHGSVKSGNCSARLGRVQQPTTAHATRSHVMLKSTESRS
jgi:hypothetical protein